MTVGIVDERSEISACHLGCPQNNIGCRTDVLDGCPKSEGMMMLVRSMSPEIAAVDEIGSREDAAAIDYVMNCGINIIATVHGLDMEEVINKPVIGELVRKRMFKRYILLKKGMMGKISAVFDDRGMLYINSKNNRFLFVTVGGSMFGRYIWERYMLRVKVLEEWQRMLIEINGEINYSAQSMSQICRQMSKTSVYGKKFWDGIAKDRGKEMQGFRVNFERTSEGIQVHRTFEQ